MPPILPSNVSIYYLNSIKHRVEQLVVSAWTVIVNKHALPIPWNNN